jgi:protein ImuB
VLADDHRPEAAHAPGPFRPPRREPGMFAEARRVQSPAPPASPDWQLERPVRLLAGEGEPLDVELDALGALRSARVLGKRRSVLAIAGPERLGGHWWSETPFQRDYYRVHFEGLGPAWVYRRADEGRFYLHGLFD